MGTIELRIVVLLVWGVMSLLKIHSNPPPPPCKKRYTENLNPRFEVSGHMLKVCELDRAIYLKCVVGLRPTLTLGAEM